MIDNSQIVFDDETNLDNEVTETNNEGSIPNSDNSSSNSGSNSDIVLDGTDVEDTPVEEVETETTEPEEEDVVSVLDILSDISGYEKFTDEDGNELTFNDDEDGVRAYLNKLKDTYITEAKEEASNSLFENYPELKDAYNYLRINGSLSGFTESTNWGSVELKDTDYDTLKSVIKEHYKALGDKADEEYLDYLEKKGVLHEKAKASLEFLKTADANAKAEYEAQIKANEEREYQETIAYWKDVESTINSGVLLGYKLPDTITVTKDGKSVVKSKSDFYNYMSKSVQDGKSQYELDLESTDTKAYTEEEILRAYIKFTGGSYKSIINMELNKEKIANNRNLRVKTKAVSSKQNVTSTKASNDEILLQ